MTISLRSIIVAALLLSSTALAGNDDINVLSYYAVTNTIDGQLLVDRTNVFRFHPVFVQRDQIDSVSVVLSSGSKDPRVQPMYSVDNGRYWQVVLQPFELGESVQKIETQVCLAVDKSWAKFYQLFAEYLAELAKEHDSSKKAADKNSVNSHNSNGTNSSSDWSHSERLLMFGLEDAKWNRIRSLLHEVKFEPSSGFPLEKWVGAVVAGPQPTLAARDTLSHLACARLRQLRDSKDSAKINSSALFNYVSDDSGYAVYLVRDATVSTQKIAREAVDRVYRQTLANLATYSQTSEFRRTNYTSNNEIFSPRSIAGQEMISAFAFQNFIAGTGLGDSATQKLRQKLAGQMALDSVKRWLYTEVSEGITDTTKSGRGVQKSDVWVSADLKRARILYRNYNTKLRRMPALDPAEKMGIFRARYVPFAITSTKGKDLPHNASLAQDDPHAVFEFGVAFGDVYTPSDELVFSELSVKRLGAALAISDQLLGKDAELIALAMTYDLNSFASVGFGANIAQERVRPYYSFGINKMAFELLLKGIAGFFDE